MWAAACAARRTSAPVGWTGVRGIATLRTNASAAKLLGVSRGASLEKVRAAYLVKARETHPDALDGDDGSLFREVQWAYEKLSKGAVSVEQEFELSELQLYKREIRSILKEKQHLWSDPSALWGLVKDDHRKRVLAIDGDILNLLVDLAVHMSNLPAALHILQDVMLLKRIQKDDVLTAYNTLLSYCEFSLRKQVDKGEFAPDTHERSLTMHEIIESLQQAEIQPDLQTHMIMSRNSRRLDWLCI
jgi:hypothetical protein